MSEKPIYYDKRSEFWKKHFDEAKEYDTFLHESDPKFSTRWYENTERTPDLDADQIERITGYGRELNVLMYAGAWCGDCGRQGPMLKKIVDAIGPNAHLKIIDREHSDELKDELRILGATRVPILVFLTEDFWEIGRFGDRLLSVYRAKAARDLGRKFRAGILSPKALKDEMGDWVDIFERMQIMVRLAPPLRRRYND